MKNFLIIVLSLALAAAAFFTRPSEVQFRAYLNGADPATAAVTERGTPGQKIFKVIGRATGLTTSETPPRDYTFRDCYLWVDVQREGKTVYVGAFAHFFDVSRFGGSGNTTEPSNDQTRPAADEQPAPAVASARQTRHGRHGS